jgi:hypothetical protein
MKGKHYNTITSFVPYKNIIYIHTINKIFIVFISYLLHILLITYYHKLTYHIDLDSVLLRTTNDNEKGFIFENFVTFRYIYIGFKFYKSSPNYHRRGDLINHLYFQFIKILEAIRVDKH